MSPKLLYVQRYLRFRTIEQFCVSYMETKSTKSSKSTGGLAWVELLDTETHDVSCHRF